MGVWIEIHGTVCDNIPSMVAPFVGVWIEMSRFSNRTAITSSLPSWECGLKFFGFQHRFKSNLVAPFVGVWIEIDQSLLHYMLHTVAPFVGVWIEILHPWITTLR